MAQRPDRSRGARFTGAAKRRCRSSAAILRAGRLSLRRATHHRGPNRDWRARVGDERVFSPANKASKVQSIEGWPEKASGEAIAGDSVGITLTEQIFVERGYVASQETETPIETNRIHADVFWIVREPMRVGQPYDLRLATQDVKCEVVSIDEVMDSSTLEATKQKRDQLERNEVGRLTIQTRAPLVIDNHDRNPKLGRFIIAHDGQICGGGTIDRKST